MKFIDEFSHSYVLDVAPDWPERGEQVISVHSYEPLGMHRNEFKHIRFYPRTGGSWIGQFERGVESESVVLSVPNENEVCVISAGAGYWVDVEARKVTNLQILPITSAVPASTHDLILISTWCDLYAHRSAEPVWSLRHIATDSLRIIAVGGDTIVTTCFGLTGEDLEMVEMEVDLASGTLLSTRQAG